MGQTATELGKAFGRTGAAMNLLLRDHGFLEGRPGAWRPTELGKLFAKAHDFDNGYGGYAYRQWGWLSWTDGIVDALKASMEAHPDGVLPSTPTPTAAVTTVTTSSRAAGRLLGKKQLIGVAAIGVAALSAPAAGRVWNEKVKPSAARAWSRVTDRNSAAGDASDETNDEAPAEGETDQ